MRTFLIGAGSLTTSVAAGISDPVGILEAALWTVEISGQSTVVTGQTLIVVTGALVGIGSLIVSILKLRKK